MARKTKTYLERLRRASKALRSLKKSGDVEEDITLIDFLDTLNTSDTEYDRLIEAESVILYHKLKGEGFVKQRCPVCEEIFAFKYQITNKLLLNPPKIIPNIKYKPAEKEELEAEIEINEAFQPIFKSRFGMHCSNACRALALKELGIRWDPTKKPENRWLIANPIDPERATDGELPLIVPPAAFETAEKLHDIEPQYVVTNFNENT